MEVRYIHIVCCCSHCVWCFVFDAGFMIISPSDQKSAPKLYRSGPRGFGDLGEGLFIFKDM